MIQAHKGIFLHMKGINYHLKDFYQIGIHSSEVGIKVLRKYLDFSFILDNRELI